MRTRLDRLRERGTRNTPELAELVRGMAHPLRGTEDLDPLLDRIGDARCVLLGEASHGTSEYYTWRTRISQRLIREKGFSFIAVEGHWPDCYEVNRYVKGYPDSGKRAREVLGVFDRWPTWMWANEEIVELAEWLRQHNDGLPDEEKVGFYGLDVYSLWDSMEEIIEYLERVDPGAVETARRAYKCFEPYGEDVREYARALWEQPVRGLFFLNGSSHLPMAFVQALSALDYRPVLLSGPPEVKVVDIAIQRTLEALAERGRGDVLLASHDRDFAPQLEWAAVVDVPRGKRSRSAPQR